jgi:hypothetical protein
MPIPKRIKSFPFPHTPGQQSFSVELQSPAFSLQPLRQGDDTARPPSPIPEKNFADAREQREARLLHWGRTTLSVVLLAAGAAITASEAHALYGYNSTHLSDEWFLPLWPQHFDLRPTIALLSAGAVIALTSLVYLISAVIATVISPSLL